MAWVVDTCVLLDVYLADPRFANVSGACLQAHLRDGLMLCPLSYIELAPAFRANQMAQRLFLQNIGVDWTEPWRWQDTILAARLWSDHVHLKRAGHAGKRPVADVFIEAFALRFQGLITRNPKDFPTVHTVVP